MTSENRLERRLCYGSTANLAICSVCMVIFELPSIVLDPLAGSCVEMSAGSAFVYLVSDFNDNSDSIESSDDVHVPDEKSADIIFWW